MIKAFATHKNISFNSPLSFEGLRRMVRRICVLKNRFSNKILSENPEVFLTNCFGQTLNVAVGDMVKNVLFLKDSMDTTYEISNFFKKSPKRDATLQKTWKDISLELPGFGILFPTRWTVKSE